MRGNCISVAAKALLLLRSEVLRTHESGSYVCGVGSWASIGPGLLRGVAEGAPSAFKVAEGVYLRCPEIW